MKSRRSLRNALAPAAALAVAAGGLLIGSQAMAQGASASSGAIFSCTDSAGRKLTSDRPIAECLDRNQRVLNRDGSLRTTLPPSLTSEERASLEDAERRKTQERAMHNDAVRRDRNLLARFPDEAAHNKARETALALIRLNIKSSEERLDDLQKQRKPLLDEAEFYKGQALPPKLSNQLEAIDVVTGAQRTLIENQQAELGRVGALYDAELGRLRLLWGGAEPGSIGPLPAVQPLPKRGMADSSAKPEPWVLMTTGGVKEASASTTR